MAVYLGSNKVGGNTDISKAPTFETIATGSCTNTEANTWFYTTVSFIVPAGHIYLVRVNTGYRQGKPIGIGIHTDTTISTATGAPVFNQESSYLAYSPTWLVGEGTYYVFCKRSGTSGSNVNDYIVQALDFDLN